MINYTPFRLLSGHLQAYLFAAASLFALPDVKDPNDAIKTFASEAIHFRRGIRKNFLEWFRESGHLRLVQRISVVGILSGSYQSLLIMAKETTR